MNKLPELSIFFPFWNEEKNIETIVKQAVVEAKKVADKWEIILIDDGSADKTFSIAQHLEKEYPDIKAVSHIINRGYGAALKTGLLTAKYNYIVFTDGDLQFNFSEIEKFIPYIKSSDIVIGFRKKRRDHKLFKRILLMNLLKIWDFMLFGFYYKDIDCGFKMFTRKALNELIPLRSEGAMITTEILAKATKKKLTITQIGVEHYPRKHGKETGSNLPVIIRAILESLILWWDIKNGRI